MLVLSIQAVNALLGCVNLSWPYSLSSLDAMKRLKVYGQMLMVVVQGIVTASGVALVEELLFRSWLPEEIAADLGYHQGIIISGLVFSVLQWYIQFTHKYICSSTSILLALYMLFICYSPILVQMKDHFYHIVMIHFIFHSLISLHFCFIVYRLIYYLILIAPYAILHTLKTCSIPNVT